MAAWRYDKMFSSHVWIKMISSHVGYRFYQFVTTRYTTNFYIINTNTRCARQKECVAGDFLSYFSG